MDPFTDEEIIDMALKDDFKSIERYCRISKRFNNLISNNQDFWHKKFILDFENYPKDNHQIGKNFIRQFLI
jgi:antirestriction protein